MTRRYLLISLSVILTLALFIHFLLFFLNQLSQKPIENFYPDEIHLSIDENNFLFSREADRWYWQGEQTQWPLVRGTFDKSRLESFLNQVINGELMIISRDRNYIEARSETGKVWIFSGNHEIELEIGLSPLNQQQIQILDRESAILYECDLSLFPEALKGLSELLQLSLTSEDSGKDLIAWKRNIISHPEYDIFMSDSNSGWKNAYNDNSISEKALGELLSAYQNWTAWAPLFSPDENTIISMEFYFSDGSESCFEIGEKNEDNLYPVIQKKDGISYLCRPENIMIFLYSNDYYY